MDFAELVRTMQVRPATDEDVVEGVRSRWVVEPADEAETGRAVAAAAGEGLAVLPRGGGTKMGWGNPPARADVVLSTRRLDRVIEHAAGDMTATVEAGCTVEALQRELARNGQRLALDPLWPGRATVGGVLATNDSGALRLGFGSLRDLVLGVTVALPDGTLARSGGKVVKNVAGYDLPKLMTGALGTLGIITRATFRLHPVAARAREMTWEAGTPADASKFMLAVQASTLAVAAIQVVAARSAPCTVQVRVEGSRAGADAVADRLAQVARGCGVAGLVSSEGWMQRERLWEGMDGAEAVCKVTFLPARLEQVWRAIDAVERWALVAQAPGVGWIRVGESNEQRLVDTLLVLRREVVALGGAMVVLSAGAEVKRRVDAWGEAGDTLPLMRRVKQQLDPARVMNPGRFVGGI